MDEQSFTASEWKRYWREEKRLAKMTPKERVAYLDAHYAYRLKWSVLQEVHTLNGMVLGWHMNLPKRMRSQAKKVSELMLKLERIKA